MKIGVFILDTLRYDYGFTYLDDVFKGNFISFISCSPANWTVPSHFSIFTGLYPSIHGIHEKSKSKCLIYSPIWSYDSILKYLRASGFRIAWLTANVFLSESFGYTGFDFYKSIYKLGGCFPLTAKEFEYLRSFKEHNKLKKIIAMIRNNKQKLLIKLLLMKLYRKLSYPLDKGGNDILGTLSTVTTEDNTFVFLNIIEAHEPYFRYEESSLDLILGRTSQLTKNRWKKGYLKAVLYLKKLLIKHKHFFEKFDILIVTSDHGQLLGEHGYFKHEWGLWDELVKVPLWIKAPFKIKPPRNKVVTTASLAKFIRAFVDGEKDPWKYLFVDYAFSECFGTATVQLPEKYWDLTEKHRIRCTSAKGSVIYNVDDDKIEWKQGKWDDCFRKIKEYLENPEDFCPELF